MEHIITRINTEKGERAAIQLKTKKKFRLHLFVI